MSKYSQGECCSSCGAEPGEYHDQMCRVSDLALIQPVIAAKSDECRFDHDGRCTVHETEQLHCGHPVRLRPSAALCTHAAATLQAKLDQTKREHEATTAHYANCVIKLKARVRELEGQGADPVAYPNLNAVIDGRVSADVGQWPRVRVELRALLARLSRAEQAVERATAAALAVREAITRVCNDMTDLLEHTGSRDSDAIAAWREELQEAESALGIAVTDTALVEAEEGK